MSNPIILGLPGGAGYGWGTAGTELTKHLQALRSAVDLSQPPWASYPYSKKWPAPVLQAIQGASFLPMYPHHWSSRRNVGYCFIEENLLMRNYLANAERYWDTVVAGSTWAAEQLKIAGVKDVRTVIQGVDTDFYCPGEREERLKDAFVIFSGGKWEYRKGQDIVMKAVSILQEKHKVGDVMLIGAWFNPWPESARTMEQSKLIDFELGASPLGIAVNKCVGTLGIYGTIQGFYDPTPPERMRQLYRNADVGLFPNRCEAGTNLVMMEFMACGKPVIATRAHGHKDVMGRGLVAAGGGFATIPSRPTVITRDGQAVAEWVEPDLDYIVSVLDAAYKRRDILAIEGERNREYMKQFTWGRAAEQFLEILES